MDAVRKETDSTKKLRLLDQWKKDYPETTHEEERTRAYMLAYYQGKRWSKAFEAAQQLIKVHSTDSAAHFVVVLVTPLAGAGNVEIQTAGESSAKLILSGGVDRPENLDDDQWQKLKFRREKAAEKALGWIAMQRGDNQAAAPHFIRALQMDPGSAQVSLWLGNAILAQNNLEKCPWAVFYLARAAEYEGDGALSPAVRTEVETQLTHAYAGCFWTEKGLDELKELAKSQQFPPAGFAVSQRFLPRRLLSSAATFSVEFLFIPAIVFFVASLTVGKFMPDKVVSALFNLSGMCLLAGLFLVCWLLDLMIRGDYAILAMTPPESGNPIDFLHHVKVLAGGWARLYAFFAFSAAAAAFAMGKLATLVDAVDSDEYFFGAAICGMIGTVELIGIALFLERTAQILGIVATVVGIIAGIIKLMDKKKTE